MKKLYKLLLLLMILGLMGCTNKSELPSLVFEHSSIAVYIEEMEILPLSLPDTYDLDDFNFSFNPEGLVSIHELQVTGIQAGSTILTISFKVDSTVSASIEIVVLELPIIDFPEPVISYPNTLLIGSELLFEINNYENKTMFSWTSSNETVATVSENGLLQTHSEGSVTIRVEHKEDASSFALLALEVVSNPIILLPQDAFEVSDELSLDFSHSLPKTDFEWVWDASFASMDSSILTLLQEGTMTLRIQHKQNPSIFAEITLEILPRTYEVPSLDIANEIFVGEDTTITLLNKLKADEIAWTSSNSTIATISETGILTAYAVGFVEITATVKAEPTLSTTITLKVSLLFDDLEDAYPILVVGTRRIEMQERIPISIANYADLNDFYWEFSDPTIAEISEDFEIIPLKIGIVTLFVTLKSDEYISEAIGFEIYRLPTEAPILTAVTTTLEIGDRIRVDLANYTERHLFDWTYTNQELISINDAFVIEVLNIGEVTVTATMKENPLLSGSITLTLLPIQPILNTPTSTLNVGGQTSISLGNIEIMESDLSGFIIEVSDDSIIELDSSYQITGLSVGTAIITITSIDQPLRSTTKTFTVIDEVTLFTSKNEPAFGPLYLYSANPEAKVQAGEFFPITIHQAYNPENYVWASLDSTIATVNDRGRVIAVQEGRVEIAAFSKEDSSIRGSITITVYGTPNVDYISRVLQIALEEEGYIEGPNNDTKYGAWYNLNFEAWCAMFVSWVAFEAGVGNDIIPRYASVLIGMNWYISRGLFEYKQTQGVYYIPEPGDIIFFREDGASHTGIVTKYENGRVYTIEGNTSNRVAQRSYVLSHNTISGYGTPAYPPYDGDPIDVDTGNADDGSDHDTR